MMSRNIDTPTSSNASQLFECGISQAIDKGKPTVRLTHDADEDQDSTNWEQKEKIILEIFEAKPIKILTGRQNLTWSRKWLITLIVLSLVYFNSIFSAAASIHSNQMERELKVDLSFMDRLQGLNVPATAFNLGGTIGPIFFAPIAETYGTIPIINLSGALFVILTMASGFMVNQSQLLLFRLCAGLLVSVPGCLSQFILAKIWGKDSRGTPMCLNLLVTVVATSIDNVLGGWTVEKTDWRWIFWISSLVIAIIHILITLFLPESETTVLNTQLAVKRPCAERRMGLQN